MEENGNYGESSNHHEEAENDDGNLHDGDCSHVQEVDRDHSSRLVDIHHDGKAVGIESDIGRYEGSRLESGQNQHGLLVAGKFIHQPRSERWTP